MNTWERVTITKEENTNGVKCKKRNRKKAPHRMGNPRWGNEKTNRLHHCGPRIPKRKAQIIPGWQANSMQQHGVVQLDICLKLMKNYKKAT